MVVDGGPCGNSGEPVGLTEPKAQPSLPEVLLSGLACPPLARQTIDDDKPKCSPAGWRFLSDIRLAGAGSGVSVGAWAVASAATIPYDRHQVKDLKAALDALLGGSAVPAEQRPSVGCNIKWKAGAAPNYFSR